MIDHLDALADDFAKQPLDRKYRWITKLRKYLLKNPELKQEYGHRLFIEVIKYHLSEMRLEQRQLQDLVNKMMDEDTDRLSYLPERYYSGRRDLIEEITARIRELETYINEYSKDLEKRQRN